MHAPSIQVIVTDTRDLSYPSLPQAQPRDPIQTLLADPAPFDAEVFLFGSRNYNIGVSFDLRPDLLLPFVAVLDICTGRNCVWYEDLPPGSNQHIRAEPLLLVNNANRKQLAIHGKISLFKHAETAVFKAYFLVC